MLNRFLASAAVVSLCQAYTLPALARGDEGHEIVGLIAEHWIKPSVKRKIDALLAGDTTNLVPHDTRRAMADEATWADKYRDQDNRKLHYAQTEQWHFVDLEIRKPDLTAACFGRPPLPAQTPASQGPANDCIVDKIEQFSKELADTATPTNERRMALQFLLHFMGDLHQPLHASGDNDRGGNDKTVTAPGMVKGNLHAYWDTLFVQALGHDPETVASDLVSATTASNHEEWAIGTPDDWAQQSLNVSKSAAYGGLPAPNADGTYTLSAEYVATAKLVVALQLRRAGARLALVLNRALGSK